MRYFLIILFALLTACGSSSPTVKPFKMDIQQGNVVTSKMLLQLKPGMTKSQVKFIMGTPLIIDSFHKDRWDYFYQLRQAGKIVEQRRVILDFDKELLTKVRGDVVPEGTAGAATGNESSVSKTITLAPKPKQEKSWADKLKFWKKDDVTNENAKENIGREKTDALQTNKQAPAGDAPAMNADAPASDALKSNLPSADAPNTDMPSVLAVPIGGVVAPEAPAVEAPIETPVIDTPAVATPTVEAPAISAPLSEAPETLAPQAETPVTPVPMPASKAGERLIFRMDRNIDLQNLQAPVEAVPAAEVEVKTDTTAAKPKKIEPPLPPEEAPGYFERMLEKIGF